MGNEQKVTAEDVINQIGNGMFQWICGGIFCCMSYAAVSIQIVNISMIISQFSNQQPTPLTPSQEGLLNSIVQIGMMIGSLAIGSIADKYGRRFASISCSAIYCIFGILQVFSVSYELMLISRLMVGVGIGAAQPLVFPTLGEFVPTNARSLFFGILNIYYFVSQALVAPLALVTVDQIGWQIFMMLTNIPSFVAFFGFVFYMPETPHYYMSVHKVEKAKKVLEIMARRNGRKADADLLEQLQPEVSEEEAMIDEKQQSFCQGTQQALSSVFSIWKSPYILTSTCVMLMWFTLQSAFIIFDVWFPAIFGEYGAKDLNVYVQATISMAVQIPGAIFSAFVVQWMGRKIIVIVIALASGIALIPTLVWPNNGVLLLVSISVSMFIVPILWSPVTLLTVELYPTKIRGMGSGFAQFVSFLGSFVFAFIMPMLLDDSAVLAVLIPMALYFIAAAGVVPLKETRGEQLHEEKMDFKNEQDDDNLTENLLPK
eukprot:TRINITY_DN6883_c1_g2_i1.p1 TRINITY_DN6883_c1_g2~~TRINITY_DN6883_c1_g2_i1.p1  ORF type:complete len:486 (-),score=43.51 TRINITY_DN6883_c1_g2_i1:803-2260(-)